MSLKEKLQQDWKAALKDGDKLKAKTISLARSAMLTAEQSGSGEVDDQKVVEILAKEIKQRREAIEEFKKGHRQDLIDEANSEIKILVKYLPQQLSEEDIEKILKLQLLKSVLIA